MTRSVASILTAARGLLEKGWCQRREWKKDGRHCSMDVATHFCIMGALYAADDDAADDDAFDRSVEYRFATNIVRSITGREGLAPDEWNDRPGRKKSDVLALMDEAIEIASGS